MTELSLDELENVFGGMGRHPKSASYNGRVINYTTKSGDSLFNLASRFHTDVNTILTLNPGLPNSNWLDAGIQIFLPCPDRHNKNDN